MKHRRAWISLFTTCTLLAQMLSVAWALPMNPSAAPVQTQQSQDRAMPCDPGTAQDEAAGAAPASCCCADACDCAALCGGGSALISTPAPLVKITVAESSVTTALAATIPAHTLTPLRPPITSQS